MRVLAFFFVFTSLSTAALVDITPLPTSQLASPLGESGGNAIDEPFPLDGHVFEGDIELDREQERQEEIKSFRYDVPDPDASDEEFNRNWNL